MFKISVSGIGRRCLSTSRSVLNESSPSSGRALDYLMNHVEQAGEMKRSEKINIKGPFINDFRPGEIYDPFDFSMAKLALERKLIKESESTKKVFDIKKLNPLDYYTNPKYLSEYVTSTGRILPRDVTKLSLKNQKRLAKAIKRARSAGLLSSVHQDVSKLVNTNFSTAK